MLPSLLCCAPAAAHATPPGHVNPIYYHLRGDEARAGDDADGALAESLLRSFMEMHTAMDYVRAAEIALRLADLRPENPIVHYNVACVMARLHRLDESLDALERAIERGWRQLAHTRLDSDLHAVRWMPRYEQLIASLEAAVQAERIRPRPLRTEPWREVAAELEANVPDVLERYQVPGATIALVRDGRLVWSAAFGVAGQSAEYRVPTAECQEQQARNSELRLRNYSALSTQDTLTPMREDHLLPVRGPLHLLAVMGVLQETPRGRDRVAKVFEHAREDHRARGRFVSRTVPPVRMTLSSASHTEPVRPRSIRHHASSEERVAPEPAFDVLRLAVEGSMKRGFADFCREHAFGPAGMRDTTFHLRDDTRGRLVTGHTRLGTPRSVADAERDRRGDVAYTTASDLARLMEAIIAAQRVHEAAESDGPALDRGARRLTQLAAFGAPPADFAVSVRPGRAGLRMEVAEEGGGVGCLMRWYPASGDGIVILYNAETGGEAAARIAHAALGGP